MIDSLYPQTLPSQTAKLVKTWQKIHPSFLDNFYLSGGTALSLQLGHRESEDLDFFNQNSFNPTQLQPKLEKFGKLNNLELATETLNAFLNNVQIQFLGYPYPLLRPTIDWNGIQLSSVIDIACTKLQTISMRGSKKDFIDLYFILQKISLETLFKKLNQKYQKSEFNQIHILKSLIYFQDAETQPMPRMHTPITWEKVKQKIIDQTTTLKI